MKYTSLQQREIFHFLFLERLLRCSDPGLYILKGGVNLRFFFKSTRYSEDMDIDVIAGTVGTLKKNGYKILAEPSLKRALQTFGIEEIIPNDPAKSKQTETTQRFRVQLISTAGERLPTKVEFSRRPAKSKSAPVQDLVDPELARRYQRPSFHAQHYSGEIAVLQKIEALAGRTETQARDVFDLDLLYRAGFAQSEMLKLSCPAELRKRAKTALENLSFNHFQGQVLEFLEPDARSSYESPLVWQQMVEQIAELLDHE